MKHLGGIIYAITVDLRFLIIIFHYIIMYILLYAFSDIRRRDVSRSSRVFACRDEVVRLMCNITGTPTPTYSWEKDGAPLVPR